MKNRKTDSSSQEDGGSPQNPFWATWRTWTVAGILVILAIFFIIWIS